MALVERYLLSLFLFVLLVLLLTPSELRAEELWERWGDRALDRCTELIHNRPGRSKLEHICDNFREVVEEEMMTLAINAGAALGKEDAHENVMFTTELAERAEKEPYRSDGDRIIRETAEHFVDTKLVSPKEMKKYFFTKSAQWLMNVAVDNKRSLSSQPVYPGMEDLERRMHSDEL